ncbi:hypothetical protein [Streptomyces sp. NPDC005989]|uniref:hypothetical protein n=1 Tax=Streptomyces sp. NPDC005989 TaxID=3156727 RepID=UPI0033C310AF
MTGESNLISPQQPSFLLPGLASTLLRERLRNWQFSPDAGREARPDARLWLTVLARQGLVEAAATVMEILVHNTVVRTGPGTSGVGRQITLRYAMTDKHNLLIDPYDPRPDFPDCEGAISGEEEQDVWTVHQMVGELFWALRDGGNVARALLRRGPVTA